MKIYNTNSAPKPGPDCASFAPLLPLMNEAGIDADDLTILRAHLATCAYCQDQFASYERLDAAVRRHLGPAAVPRLSVEDIVGGFAPERAQATRTLAAVTENERDALVMGRHDTHLKDQAPIDLRLFQPERPYAMRNPLFAFRAGGSRLQRFGAIAAAVLLIALIGGFTTELILALHHRGAGPASTSRTNIYIATEDGWVYKLNAQSHALQWKKQIADTISGGVSTPTVVDGVVYGSIGDGSFSYALNASDGSLRWGYNLPSNGDFPFNPSPLIANGAAYLPSSSDGSVYALNAATGKLLWHTPVAVDNAQAQDSLVLGLTFGDGVLYGSEQSYSVAESSLFALNPSSGALLWRTPTTGDQPFGTSQFANGMLFAVSTPPDETVTQENYISAYNAKTGAQLWRSQPLYADLNVPPIVVNGTLYVVGYNRGAGIAGYIYALNTASGEVLWRYNNAQGAEEFFTPPVVVDGGLYISGKDVLDLDFVLALNASDGAVRWRYRTNFLDESLAVQGGVLYISLDTGVLYAFRASDGSVLWHASYVTGSFYGSAPVTVAP